MKKEKAMKRTGICGLAGLLLLVGLSAPAWAYTVELTYGTNANHVIAEVAWPTNFFEEDSGTGSVTKSVSSQVDYSTATGASTVTPAAALDGTQSLINTSASAYWYGYGQGFGESHISFIIHADSGESPQVLATIGFAASGILNLQTVDDDGGYNYLWLYYTCSLVAPDLSETMIASDSQTWNDATLDSAPFDSGQPLTLALTTEQIYTIVAVMQVGASGWANESENNINFDAFISLDNIQAAAVPLPAGIWLLAGGLGVLGLARRRRRS
jgi:hypothetical protein